MHFDRQALRTRTFEGSNSGGNVLEARPTTELSPAYIHILLLWMLMDL
jgi:hypothetical protein